MEHVSNFTFTYKLKAVDKGLFSMVYIFEPTNGKGKSQAKSNQTENGNKRTMLSRDKSSFECKRIGYRILQFTFPSLSLFSNSIYNSFAHQIFSSSSIIIAIGLFLHPMPTKCKSIFISI